MQSETAEARSKATVAAPEHHIWRGYFLIVAATFCWGAAATAGKAVFSGQLFSGAASISPLVLTQARTTFSVLVLIVILLVRFGPRFFRISARDFVLSMLVGTLGLASSNYFYYLAIQKSTVAIAITLQYTAPIWVLLAMIFSGREAPSARRFGAVLLAIFGCALTIDLLHSGRTLSAAGVAAAMVASFAFAFYNILAQMLVTRNHQFKVMVYALLGAAILWAVVNPPWRLVSQPYTGAQWGFLFLFACLSMLVPYFFYFSGLKYLDPTGAVIASCLEPVFAIMFAAVFVHERLRAVQAAGVVAVLAASIMVQMQRRRMAMPE